MSGAAASVAVQPDALPELQEHHHWIEAITVRYELALLDQNPTPYSFVPCQRIRSRFREDEYTYVARLRDLVLCELAHEVPKRHLAEEYAVVFCILLSLGRGAHILSFVKHYDLRDAQLPFLTRPRTFPRQNDDFWQEFWERQWVFCCPSIARLNDCEIQDEYILPFKASETLEARGGSAVIRKVAIHEDYDALRCGAEEETTAAALHTYIIKTYQGDLGRECYYREVSAFRRLSEDGRPNPSMIRYYGSFRHRGTFNVILEFATAGTLEEFFQTQSPPTKGEDIIAFYRSLFEVIKALDRLHEQSVNHRETQQQTVLHGWHRDIKPKNILVMRRHDVSPYLWSFKLADLGLSHVQSAKLGSAEVGAPDAGGTSTYGAPELYARTDFLSEQHIAVKRSSDIWSLGCVLSEATVWVVSGWRRLLECRGLRQQDQDRHHNFLGGDCFHNGTRMRYSVRKVHAEVRDEARNHDCITPRVIYLIENHMLHENPNARYNTKQVHIAVEEACADAIEELSARRSLASPPGVSGSTTWTAPSFPPRESSRDLWHPHHGSSMQGGPPHYGFVTHSFVQSPKGSMDDLGRVDEVPDDFRLDQQYKNYSPPVIHSLPSRLRKASKRPASVSVPSNPAFHGNGFRRDMARSGSTRTSKTAPDHHVSFDESANDFIDQRFGELAIRPNPAARDTDSEHVSIPRTARVDEQVQDTLPGFEMEDNENALAYAQQDQQHSDSINTPMRRFTGGPANGHSPHLEGQNAGTPTSPERAIPQSPGSSTDTMTAVPVGQRDSHVSEQGQAKQSQDQAAREHAQSSTSAPEAESDERLARKLQAEFDAMDRAETDHNDAQVASSSVSGTNDAAPTPKKSGKLTYVKRPDYLSVGSALRIRQDRRKLENEYPVNFRSLKGRDHIFLVDDSESMAPYWDEMENLLGALAYIVKRADQDGVELYFMRSGEEGKSSKSKTLLELVRAITPAGEADPSTRLTILIHEQIRKYTQQTAKRRMSILRANKTPGNATIYILTTGRWQPGCDLKPLIATLVQKLREQRLFPAPIGIQFIRFGNDEACKKKLDVYDNGLGLELDIIDTEHSQGNVWKMLLGSINTWFDNDE